MRIRRAIDRISHRGADVASIGAAGVGLRALDSDASALQRRFVWRLLTILAGLVAAISLTGFFYLKRQQTSARANVYSNLSAIAELKMAQIVDWRNERLGDARLLMHTPSLARNAAALFANPDSAAASSEILAFIKALRDNYRYDAVVLFDNRMNSRLAVPSAAETSGPRLHALLEAVPGAGGVLVSDLHVGINGDIHLDMVAPIRDFAARPPGQNSDLGQSVGPPVGAMLLRINPRDFLYPLIRTWPTPSATAETLLVRREGDEVVFLSELRHRKGTALALRRPVSDFQLPAAMAARGERGVFEGVDYRGVPVLAAVQAVPDSPWMLVTKVDQVEAYAPIRAEAWRTGLMAGLLLLAVVLAAAYLWRRRHAALLHRNLTERKQIEAKLREGEAAARAQAEELAALMAATPAITFIAHDPECRRMTSSQAALRLLRLPDDANTSKSAPPGERPEAFRAMKDGRELRPEELPVQLAAATGKAVRTFELTLAFDDGTARDIVGDAVPLFDAEGKVRGAVGAFLDITERKRSEAALASSLSLLQATLESTADGLLVVNQTGQIVQFNQKFAEMWRIPADILASHDDSRAIAFVLEQLKDPAGFVAKVKELYAQPEAVSFDVLEFKDGRTFERYSQPQKVVGKDAGRVWSFRDITEHKRAQKALCESEARYRELFDGTKSCVAVYTAWQEGEDFVFTDFNRASEQTEKVRKQDVIGRRVTEVFSGIREFGLLDVFQRVWKTGQPEHHPVSLYIDDRIAGWKENYVYRLPSGEVVTVYDDVTAQKQAEEALRESKTRYAALFEHNPIETIFVDRNGRIQSFNRAKRESGDRLPQIGEVMYRDYASKHTMDMHGELMDIIRSGESRHYPERPYGKRILSIDIAPFPDGAIITSQDITERQRTEEALKREFTMRSMLLENLPCIAMVLRKGTREIVFLNEAARQAGGTPGMTCYGTCSQRSDPCPFCLAPEVWATNQPRRLEVEYQGKHYEGRWVPLTDDLYVHYIFDITERKRSEESLRLLSLWLSRTEDEERRRIARELHDSTGQKLAALSMIVGLLQDAAGAPDGKTVKLFADCVVLIEQCAQEIRTHSYLLHPPLLDELGLAAAIGDYVEGFSKRSGMQVVFDAPPDLERLPGEVEIALFRVVQECLGNIHRHAGASTARIRLACDAEQVTLEVIDQGRGMSAETLRAIEAGRGSAGVGIAGMQERLRLLGGRLEIESGGQGTTVRAIVPRRESDGGWLMGDG